MYNIIYREEKLKLRFREVRFAAMLHETQSSTVFLRFNKAKDNRGLFERVEDVADGYAYILTILTSPV